MLARSRHLLGRHRLALSRGYRRAYQRRLTGTGRHRARRRAGLRGKALRSFEFSPRTLVPPVGPLIGLGIVDRADDSSVDDGPRGLLYPPATDLTASYASTLRRVDVLGGCEATEGSLPLWFVPVPCRCALRGGALSRKMRTDASDSRRPHRSVASRMRARRESGADSQQARRTRRRMPVSKW